MKTPSIKLTYFDIEGAAEPVRLALILSKTPFEDNRIQFEDWPKLKAKTPGGQVPVMTIDDGPMRTQSKAMLRWVGCTLSDTLYSNEKLFDIEEAIGVAEDLQKAFSTPQQLASSPAKFGHPQDFAKTDAGKKFVQEMREKFVSEELPKYLKRFTAMISSHGGKWLVAGDEPTVADCVVVPLLRWFTTGILDHVNPNCLDGYPVVVEYIKNFCALDQIKGRYSKGLC